MMPNISLFWYGLVIVLAIIGFFFLAMASKRESLVLFNRDISAKEKFIFKATAWSFLVVSFFICIYLWKFSYGTVLYFGILTFSLLFVIFPISYLAYKKEAFKSLVSKRKDEIKDKVTLKKLSLVLIVLLIGLSYFNLSEVPKQSVLRDDAIEDKLGEFEFILAQHDRGEIDISENGVAFMSFNIRFCEECDLKIDDIYIKINKPLSEKNFGISFRGNYWERMATIQVPFNLDESSELYLTVIGRDKKVYQKAYNIKENFEDSFNEFIEYSKNPRLEIKW